MNKSIKKNAEKIGFVLAIAFSLLIVVRWCYYINTYSVNILFWDQWDFYDALFNNNSLWEIFRWQSGPHRQGVGLILTKVIAAISGWNTRAEAFAIGGIVFLAMLAALALRRKLGPRLNAADVAIPLMFLTPLQHEIFAGTPFMAIGPVPLFLFMLYSFVWVAWRGPARFVTILILNFLLIYTGYGMFVGMITPCLFGMEALHSHRARDRKGFLLALGGVAISLISAGTFFIGYEFMSGVNGFQFPIREWWRYPQFMALMLANFCGIKGGSLFSYATGFLIILLMGTLAVIHFVRSLSPRNGVPESPANAIIAVLIAFTLIFCSFTAIGRVSLGLGAAQAPRYITNMIPGFFGIYLWLVGLPTGVLRRFLIILAVACLIAANFPLREADRKCLNWYFNGKTRWKTAYLQTEDIGMATRAAKYRIYPKPEETNLKQKLEYLKKEKLNLYLDAP